MIGKICDFVLSCCRSSSEEQRPPAQKTEKQLTIEKWNKTYEPNDDLFIDLEKGRKNVTMKPTVEVRKVVSCTLNSKDPRIQKLATEMHYTKREKDAMKWDAYLNRDHED